MSISESQLSTWSNQGATATSAATYKAVQAALDERNFPEGATYAVYLQGSYRNATNIRSDSDVDVVVELTSAHHRDTSRLDDDERSLLKRQWREPRYGFSDFVSDVEEGLRAKFGYWSVGSHSKAIHVDADSHGNRLASDVIPCMTHRRYTRYANAADNDYSEGMAFKPGTLFSGWIVNWPRQHYDNGVRKHASTGDYYKRIVRIAKNARNHYNAKAFFEIDAPSYFVECLLYQVPSSVFGYSLQDSYKGSLDWLSGALDEAAAKKWLCQNQKRSLFGDSPDQWSLDNARGFASKLRDHFDEW